jgi:hypothetical protein
MVRYIWRCSSATTLKPADSANNQAVSPNCQRFLFYFREFIGCSVYWLYRLGESRITESAPPINPPAPFFPERGVCSMSNVDQ